MATRKVKRFNQEGYVSDDAILTEDQNAKNAEDAGTIALEKIRDEAAAEPANFKEAFAAARSAGDKTFTWNGKSYTTQMAGASKPAASTAKSSTRSLGDDTANPAVKQRLKDDQYNADVKQGPKKGQYMTLQDRAREYERARAASGTGMYGTKKSEPAETKKTPGRGVIDTKNIRENTLLPTRGMKKGGMTASSRADGIATRGKTKCKMR